MIAYASNTGTRRNLAALRQRGHWRILLTPDKPRLPEGFRFAIDNGAWKAYQQGTPFDGPTRYSVSLPLLDSAMAQPSLLTPGRFA